MDPDQLDLDLHCFLKGLYPGFSSVRINCHITVKHVLSSHSKINKTKVLKTNESLMRVKSILECSLGAFCNPFDTH